ncbi:uncharacterized protein LOC120275279 [Dioscorea cayenensis subsp. rotundata]|uniref:Uncharacterized protein LOC120275279 n=1 Tax=Dioscorea cayennensis subsp. rotundata TaxID=55577 RepID=A0AB40CHK2_DIOCR|nr:uncharacterized protein LOC120275279 [Dioscorea cayenensis subsp. rotundata]
MTINALSPLSAFFTPRRHLFNPFPSRRPFPRRHPPPRVVGDSKGTKTSTDPISERAQSDQLVDGMDFGELCNDFECISSPLVESTARQLVRDILEMREQNRSFGCFSVSIKYKDPVRNFIGREKYNRPLWATDALEKPTATVQEMVMLSTSVLNIKWTLKGKPKFLGFLAGNLIVRVNSRFTLNQISGQVVEHEETWDLSESSPIAQAYFWISRRFFAAIDASKDSFDAAKNMQTSFSTDKENMEPYPDPSTDPTKFFQSDDGMQKDAYQIALFLAIVYFVVQFLRTTL